MGTTAAARPAKALSKLSLGVIDSALQVRVAFVKERGATRVEIRVGRSKANMFGDAATCSISIKACVKIITKPLSTQPAVEVL